MGIGDFFEAVGEAAEGYVLGPIAVPLNAAVDAVSEWDPWTHFTAEQSQPATHHEPTFGEMRNAPHATVADLPEPRGFINNIPTGSDQTPLGMIDELHAAKSAVSFTDIENAANGLGPSYTTPPSHAEPAPPAPVTPPAQPAPATHTEPAAGHGIAFDLDFGGGATGTGGYHVHLSGLDEQSAEDLLDHLSGADAGFGQGAAQAAHTAQAAHAAATPDMSGLFIPAQHTAADAADHLGATHDAAVAGDGPLGWDGNPVGAEHADWQTLRPADADDDLTHAHEAAGAGDEAAVHHMAGF